MGSNSYSESDGSVIPAEYEMEPSSHETTRDDSPAEFSMEPSESEMETDLHDDAAEQHIGTSLFRMRNNGFE